MWRSRVATLGLGLALGCGSHEPPPPSPSHCVEPGAPKRVVDGALDFGLGEGESFAPLAEGMTVTIIHGPQGGWMITPAVRLDQHRLGTDGVCAYLELEADVDALDPIGLHFRLSDLVVDGSYTQTHELPLLLSFNPEELASRVCHLSATWKDDDAAASADVSLLLESP